MPIDPQHVVSLQHVVDKHAPTREWGGPGMDEAVISETRAKGIVVPEHYEPASPRYAVAYWLAAMQSELLCAELAAADCMDDADDLIADLATVGLTIVRKATS